MILHFHFDIRVVANGLLMCGISYLYYEVQHCRDER